MARTPLVKALEEANIKDGLPLNFAGQEPRNDNAVIDSLLSAQARRIVQVEKIDELIGMIRNREI